jgi:hypothetical protein
MLKPRASGRFTDAYQKDLQSLNERLKKAILSYADATTIKR